MSEKKQTPPARQEDEAIQFGDELPVLPIRNAVLFPGAVAPFDVGREKSVALVEDVDNLTAPVIAIFAQRDPSTDDPGKDDLHQVGCAARVLKALKHSSGNYSLILQGLTRIRLDEMTQTGPYLKAKVARLDEQNSGDDEAEALSMSLRDIAKQVIQLMPELPREAGSLIDSIQAPGALADLVAANLDAPVDEKAQLLETVDVKDRIRKVLKLLTRQLEILKMRERINSQIKEEMGKNQREYVLRQQLKAIKEELGEDEGDQGDLDGLEERIAKASLPTEAEQVAKKQLKRLRNMQVGSAEYTVVRTYLDWILDLPWHLQTPDNMDIGSVRKVLDEDHYGLEKVKKRILEYLAVRKLKKDKKGPILCLIGPPGVGKTSLGKSIARALGRKFVRISLGGVHDEAAIRGHRRTYVGALPGQIIQGMKKGATINPVFMMDEVDKIGHDFRGDPAAALLEVLDPEQNNTFADHYLEIPYDLSNVMFVATANTMNIPAALLDRMEVRSPYSGQVVGLSVFGTGAVIARGEKILDVVPDGTPLVVQAQIAVQDIADLKPGMPAEVHFTAYKQRVAPLLHGTVAQVSADRLTDSRTGAPYYVATVDVDQNELAASPDIKLYPGMPATVMITTAKRTAFDYLVGPLTASFDRSFRQK